MFNFYIIKGRKCFFASKISLNFLSIYFSADSSVVLASVLASGAAGVSAAGAVTGAAGAVGVLAAGALAAGGAAAAASVFFASS